MKKILFLVQLPPPVHGASNVNASIRDSHYINSKIDAKFVNISPARGMTDIGKLSISKILATLHIFLKCILQYQKFAPNLVYITLSPHGLGFWKDALILQVLKIFGAKAVIHLHGKGINSEVSRSKVKRYIYQIIFKDVNVIHLSKSLFNDIDLVFDKKMSLTAVNNGVENHGANEHSRLEVPIFLYLSNLVPTKGADTLVDAINLLDDAYEGRFKVRFVGKISNQRFYTELVSKVDERFKRSVEFTGPLYGEEKLEAFKNSDVFVLPTKNDCFPLSILEAMSFSLPVLSTYEGAIPDIIDDNINGWLFESCDANELASKLANYIDNPGLITCHGHRANLKYKEKYTLEAFEKSFLTALIGVMNHSEI